MSFFIPVPGLDRIDDYDRVEFKIVEKRRKFVVKRKCKGFLWDGWVTDFYVKNILQENECFPNAIFDTRKEAEDYIKTQTMNWKLLKTARTL